MEYRLSELPGGGVAATDATLREIARICRNDLQSNQAIRFQATAILRAAGVPGKDTVREARALFEWVRSNVRYQKDPLGIETVQSPVVTLRLRAGDCDDQAGLLASLAASVGIPARFRVLGTSADRLFHIVAELYAGSRWWWADTTERAPFGVRPRPFPVERIYNFEGEVSMLGALSSTLPVTAGQFKDQIRSAVWNTLVSNWKNGMINSVDVIGYLRVIDEGNFITKNPLIVDPTRAAIQKFLAWAPKNLGPSRKVTGGLSGLNGFLSSIGKAIGGVVSVVTGGGAGAVVSSAGALLKQAQGHNPGLNDLEAAVNSDGTMTSWMGKQRIGLSQILAYASQSGGISWIPVTSSKSFLDPPTLPMYLLIPSGQLSMDPNTHMPFAGQSQTVAGGAAAVGEIVKQFGAGSSYLTSGDWYKLRPSAQTGENAVTSTIQAGMASPWLWIGLAGVLAYMVFSSPRRSYARAS